MRTLLALVSARNLSEKDFELFSARKAAESALYNVSPHAGKARIELEIRSGFHLFASPDFLVLVIVDLLKDSLEALNTQEHGRIVVVIAGDSRGRCIEGRDNVPAIEETAPHL